MKILSFSESGKKFQMTRERESKVCVSISGCLRDCLVIGRSKQGNKETEESTNHLTDPHCTEEELSFGFLCL